MTVEKAFLILLDKKPSLSLKEHEKDIFCLIPQLEACKEFKQNNDWHIYDVYEHILHVIDNVPCDVELRIAALFHDIGKPLTYVSKDGIGHFPKHWEVSNDIFLYFSTKNNMDKKITETISNLIYYHDIDILKDDECIFKLCDKLGYENTMKLLILKKADLLAQNPKYHDYLEVYDEDIKRISLKYDKDYRNMKY